MNPSTVPRVAYVSYTNKDVAGIVAKVERQAAAARAVGLDDLDVYLLHPQQGAVSGHVKLIQIQPRPLRKAWDHATGRFSTIERSVDLSRYDYVLLRYPTADPSGLGFVRRHRVITEHHSNELAELAVNAVTPATRIKQAFAAWSWVCEKTLGHRILSECRGLIGVTEEIAQLELARVSRDLPATTISNGIEVASIRQTGFKKFDGKTLDLALVASGSMSWHGIDRVARSLAAYRGPVTLRLHVVGHIYEAEQHLLRGIHAECVFHGVRRGAELDAVMAEMNLAVSTMALFRKHMQQACSLKTREYVARGIPFILAYDDSDLDRDAPFAQQFANDDSVFDAEEVIALAERATRDHADLPGRMRAYAEARLDWRAKMPRYMRFIEQVAARG